MTIHDGDMFNLVEWGPVLWPSSASDALRVHADAVKTAQMLVDRLGDQHSGPRGTNCHSREDRISELLALRASPVYFWEPSQSALVTQASKSYPLTHDTIRTIRAPGREPPSWFPRGLMRAFCVFKRPALSAMYDTGVHPFVAFRWATGISVETGEIRLQLCGYEWRPLVTSPIWWSDDADMFSLDRDIPRFIEHGTYEEYQDERLQFIQWICTASTFIEQQILASERHPSPRRLKKQYTTVAPEVHVVTLRKERHDTHQKSHADIEYSCRWWVRGHWRNQWFPSRRQHAPMWIAPHTKGPQDKPLRAMAPTVHRVSR